MMIWWKAILIILVCGLLAAGGVKIIKPAKEWEMVVWAICFSVFVFGCEGLIAYRLRKRKKVAEEKLVKKEELLDDGHNFFCGVERGPRGLTK